MGRRVVKRRLILTALSLGIASAFCLAQEDGWSRYKPSTLADVVAHSKATQKVDPEEIDLVSGQAGYLVKLRCSGQTRPIDTTAKAFIVFWAKTLGLPAATAGLFESEARFSEGEETYWLPIQSSLLPDIEANKGALVEVYVGWLGSIGNQRFFFVVNRFDGPR
jgi:hypothetical protein